MDKFERGECFEEDDNVTDYASYTDEAPSGNIRLKSAIDMGKLLNNEGIFLEPEIDESNWREDEAKSYFKASEADIEVMVKECHLGDDDEPDENDDRTLFERIAQKMVDITPDGGVKKRILTPGLESDGPVPDKGTVTIHYSLCLEDQDEPYDSTYLRGRPERYRLDEGQVIPGLEIALKSMKNSEKSEFMIEPYYAYGEMGCPPRVPKNAKILARVEMLNFAHEGLAESVLAVPPEERKKKYTFSELVKIAQKEHVDGNRYVEKLEYKLAAKSYERGCRILEDAELANDDDEAIQKRLLLKLYLNRGLCYIKVSWPKKACIALQEALAIDNRNAKAMYRLAIGKRMLCDYDDARRHLIRALNVDPTNPSIGAELANVDNLIRKEKDSYQAMCQNMFGNTNRNRFQMANNNRSNVAMDDDEYAEIMDQLREFKLDDTQTELLLPSGFDSDAMRVVRTLSSQMELSVEPGRFKNQYKVTKK